MELDGAQRGARDGAREEDHAQALELLAFQEDARDQALPEPVQGRLGRVHERDGRLHGCVNEERHEVLGLDRAPSISECLLDVSAVANNRAALACGRAQRVIVGAGVVFRKRAVVPFDLQPSPAFDHRPRIRADDCNTTERSELCGPVLGQRRNLDDLLDTLHLQRRARIEGSNASSVHGRSRNHGDLHARKRTIRAIGSLTGAHIEVVDNCEISTDVLPFRWIFESQGAGSAGVPTLDAPR